MIWKSGKRIDCFLVLALFISSFLFFSFANADSPEESMLDIGIVVNSKMKSLAAEADKDYWMKTSDIKAICMAGSLPDNFIPSDANTVSIPDSKYPVYIFFDNKEDSGIMYFYTKSDTIVMNPNSSFMFAYNEALKDISCLANWDTSNVTDMLGLFSDAISLSDALFLRNWDTSNVTDMSFMFSGCTSILFVDVSNWNTSKVTTMANMFQVGESWKSNGQLIEIMGLGNLDVSNVTDMTCMFYGAGQMTSYDIARWDVSKVESMNHMFCDNRKLRSLDLSNWDVSCLKTIYNMFNDNISLKTIGDVSHWNTASLIDAGSWLQEASAFVSDNNGMLDLSGWNTSNLKSAGGMFMHTSLHTVDLSGWTFDSITNDLWEGVGQGIYYEAGNKTDTFRGLGSMFKNSTKLKTVYISQAGLESYNKVVEKGVNTLDMWSKTRVDGFTVK